MRNAGSGAQAPRKATALIAQIKARVCLPDVVARYVPGCSPRNGRIPCPVHGGKNYNFSYDENVYHCFVCGCKGDLVRLTQDIFGLDIMGAIRKIDGDFGLNLPIDRKRTLREMRDERRIVAQKQREREEKAAAEKAEQERYWAILEKIIQLEQDLAEYAPTNPDAPIHPRFVDAVHKIDYQKYLLFYYYGEK